MADWSHSLREIVERQISSWEAQRRHEKEQAEQEAEEWPRLAEGPWVSISRQSGVGADEVGRELASRLHWSFYDRELLTAIADRIELPAAFLERFDEQSVGALDDLIVRPGVPGDPGQLRYLIGLTAVIRQIGRRGHAVIVGRGANWILDPQHGVRVRLIASLDQRIAEMARRRGIDESAAARLVRAIDRERRDYIEQVFGQQVDDPLGYDALINVSSLGRPAVVAAIEAAVRTKIAVEERRVREAEARIEGR